MIIKDLKEIASVAQRNEKQNLQPQLTDTDMRIILQKLNLTPDEVRENYSETDEFNDTILSGSPCVFLTGNQCQIYDARPEGCKSYPHLHKEGFTSRLFGVMENISICPIVSGHAKCHTRMIIIKYRTK